MLTARRRRCEMQHTKFILDEKAIPESWYNLVPDLPFQLDPPLNPATMEPVGPEAFAPIFPGYYRAGSDAGLVRAYPRRGAGDLHSLASDSSLPRPPTRKVPRYPGSYLLQVRRCQPTG